MSEYSIGENQLVDQAKYKSQETLSVKTVSDMRFGIALLQNYPNRDEVKIFYDVIYQKNNNNLFMMLCNTTRQ